MWGHRFPNIVEYDRKNAVYVADYDRFDSTEPVSEQTQYAKYINLHNCEKRLSILLHCAIRAEIASPNFGDIVFLLPMIHSYLLPIPNTHPQSSRE